MAFAHLNQIDASLDGEAGLHKETALPIRIGNPQTSEAPRISDETDRQEPRTQNENPEPRTPNPEPRTPNAERRPPRSRPRHVVAERHLSGVARGEHRREIGEPGKQVHEAESADRAADVVVAQEAAQRRPREGEIVLLPECRPPGHHDQQQTDLDEEDDVEKTPDQNQLPACTLVSRSIRSSTSL